IGNPADSIQQFPRLVSLISHHGPGIVANAARVKGRAIAVGTRLQKSVGCARERLPNRVSVGHLVAVHDLFFSSESDVAIALDPLTRRDATANSRAADVHGRVGIGCGARPTHNCAGAGRERRHGVTPGDALVVTLSPGKRGGEGSGDERKTNEKTRKKMESHATPHEIKIDERAKGCPNVLEEIREDKRRNSVSFLVKQWAI